MVLIILGVIVVLLVVMYFLYRRSVKRKRDRYRIPFSFPIDDEIKIYAKIGRMKEKKIIDTNEKTQKNENGKIDHIFDNYYEWKKYIETKYKWLIMNYDGIAKENLYRLK